VRRWGSWAPRILQILLFRNPNGRRVRQFGPQNPAYGGAKISGEPRLEHVFGGRSGGITTCEHSQGVDTGAPEIIRDYCIHGIHGIYGCLDV